MSWRTWKWTWRRPSLAEAVAVAILALLLVVAAFNAGWITPPAWYTSRISTTRGPVAAPPLDAASAAVSAKAAQVGAETAARSAQFAADGSAKSASSAASAAKAAAAAAAVAEAAAQAAKKAAVAKSRSAKKKDEAKQPAAAPAQPAAAVEPGASGGFRWVHFGVASFAASREEAMRKRESAFRALGFPEPVVAKLMIATETPGEKTRINVGDKLGAMLSKGGVVHTNVTVAFGSPSRGMELAAPAEKWTVAWEGKTYTALLPEVCNNWSLVIGPAPTPAPVAAAPAPPAPAPVVGSCPDVYTLKVNVWQRSALGLPRVERTHAREELAETFADVPRVSRMHGAQFRKAYATGDTARSATPRVFRVSLIMTPEAQGGAPTITAEEVIGDVSVTGLRELQFSRKQLERWDAIRVVANNGDVLSPPRYHRTGLHELRFFNRLPRTTLGEWDENPVPDCIMNEHWIE